MNKVEVIPGISDHEIVYIESSLRPDTIKKPQRKVYLYNKMNHTLMRQGLAEVDSVINEIKTNDISIDDLWNNFKEKVLDAVNKGNNKIIELRTILPRESQNS